jgi:hypothetical protein
VSGTIRIDEGEDYIAKFQRWQSKKWYKRISFVQWVGMIIFFAVVAAVSVWVVMWLVDYVAVNGFDFNPIPVPRPR